jgi:hypothetical protein
VFSDPPLLTSLLLFMLAGGDHSVLQICVTPRLRAACMKGTSASQDVGSVLGGIRFRSIVKPMPLVVLKKRSASELKALAGSVQVEQAPNPRMVW